jgi:hypothetical protein
MFCTVLYDTGVARRLSLFALQRSPELIRVYSSEGDHPEFPPPLEADLSVLVDSVKTQGLDAPERPPQ